MESKILKSDFKNLDLFVRAMSDKYAVKVGVLGKKNGRKDDPLSNADVGYLHEIENGSSLFPQRSFIRMPLTYKSNAILESVKKAGALKNILMGKMNLVMRDLGIICENAIQDAFNTQGFGTWAANKPSTIARKGSSSPLIDTAQLRRSISSEVIKK